MTWSPRLCISPAARLFHRSPLSCCAPPQLSCGGGDQVSKSSKQLQPRLQVSTPLPPSVLVLSFNFSPQSRSSRYSSRPVQMSRCFAMRTFFSPKDPRTPLFKSFTQKRPYQAFETNQTLLLIFLEFSLSSKVSYSAMHILP